MNEVALPAEVEALLHDGERAFWHAQPIRHAHGTGVWLIMGLGVVFTAASAAALVDVVSEPATPLALAPLALACLLLAFSSMMLAWPLLSYARMRRTHVVITDQRVLHVVSRRRGPRVREHLLAECTDPAVVRRRGRSATLVLSERLRERKSDGQTVYEWNALHGVPDADGALLVLRALKGE